MGCVSFEIVDAATGLPKFPDKVLFASTLGDGKGIHYRFRMPLEVWGRQNCEIRLYNMGSGEEFPVPMRNCQDVLYFAHFLAPDVDNKGWGGLGLARCGYAREP